MQTITLTTATSVTNIFVGLPFIDFKSIIGVKQKQNHRLKDYYSNIVIITDSNVNAIYGKYFSELKVIELKPGESSKSLKTVDNIYKQLLNHKLDKQGLIIGIGGGVVSDISGFAASTYLRGVRFGFIATSLLAQVDAAIGGKNGVNLLSYKNIIGSITQPEFVICDSGMIKTLPALDYRCGIAEIVKSALAGNKELFRIIEQNPKSILKKEKSILNKIILKAIKFKVSIVEKDERDKGIRHILNLGHTFAHAIESKTGMFHGEAVAIGICKAAEISLKMGLLNNSDYHRIISILKIFKLPIETKLGLDDIFTSMMMDKKHEVWHSGKKENDKDLINLILLKGIGNAVIHKFKIDELRKLYQ